MSDKIYTQEDVDDLRRQWESAQFELKTNEVLKEINKRLDESNNYKNTIGKDVRELKTKVEQNEVVRAAEAKKIAEALTAKETSDKQRYEWYQDKWIRVGIAGGLVWEIWTILGDPIKQAMHTFLLGK